MVINQALFISSFLFFLLSSWLGVYADTPDAKTPEQIIQQEIEQYEEPQVLQQTLVQIFDESNATNQLKLITSVLELLHKDKQPYLWGLTHEIAGMAFQQLHDSDRAENLEQAITHYQQALEVYTRQAFPEDWAITQSNLVVVYLDRIRGERAENLEQALIHAQQALEVHTRRAFPADWARTQNNLVLVYRDRIRGERAENLEQALTHAQQALEVRTRQAFPVDWARTQSNLVLVYLDRIRGERAENLEQALIHAQQALEVSTRQAFPVDWARTQSNLAVVYLDRIRGERAENLEQALIHAQQALEVHTRQAFPVDWARTQSNLVNVYRDRIRGERAENLEQALAHAQQALEVSTRQAFPVEWARTQSNLVLVYLDRIRGERAENLEQALIHAQQALEVFTRQAFPVDWARTQSNLGLAYFFRIRGERAENLEQVLTHVQQALEVYTRQAFPVKWARTQSSLALVYLDRIHGERAENLEQALTHAQQALEVYTHQAFPVDWARTQSNLAVVYLDRIRGERAENLEQALTYAQQALKVYTPQNFPEEFIRSAANLSEVLLTTQQWSAALKQLESALQTNEMLLQQISFTPEERQRLVKKAETLFANAVWAAVQQGEYTEAIQLLEWGKTRLLRQNLALDTVHLQTLPAAQQTQLHELQKAVNNLDIQLQTSRETDPTILTQLRTELKEQRQHLREQVQKSGITATQAPPFATIRQWLQVFPANSVFIAPVFTDFGTVVFLMPVGVTQIEAQQVLILPTFSRKDLQKITRGTETDRLGGYLEAYGQWTDANEKPLRDQKQQAWQQQLTAALEQLRVALLEPVITRLAALKIQPGAHLFWLPDSDSGLLPIHAIQIEQHPLLSRYIVHFIPSLYSGYTAQQHLLNTPPVDHPHQLLALINPTENLDYAPIEGELVSHLFAPPSRVLLQGTEGTRDRFKQALAKQPRYLHLSTHGSYHWLNPLESGFALAKQERWTLSDLMTNTDLKGSRLAVLSACETGITDITMSTEVFGLPAGFLQAGVPGVISTLWTVDDRSTTILLGKFYELHLTQGIAPATALGQAQEWLRTATYRDLRDWLSLHLPEQNSPLFHKMLELLNAFRTSTMKTPEVKPYRELYYWAGFVYTGV